MRKSGLPFGLSLPLLVFLAVRLPILLATPYEGLRGYGDFTHFFNLAQLNGWPCLNYWVEFPPFFPLLSKVVYLLSGGVEHVYTYILILLLLMADLGSVAVFTRLVERLSAASSGGETSQEWRGVLFAAILGGLAYAWWYFDSFAVFFTLLTLYFVFTGRPSWLTGAVLGLGILTKLFPAILLPALWRALPPRRAAIISGVGLALTLVVYGALWAGSPGYTRASLQSQSAKGSWESVWALLDNNLKTGNFGPEIERYDPATASQPRGNPSLVSSWLTLGVFALAGLYLFLKSNLTGPAQVISFAGLTWVIFLLWSPGWSVQWVLYLVPLILLTLPKRLAVLLALALVLANLLEWPLLLSRGFFQALPFTILLRTLLMILLALAWRQEIQSPATQPESLYPVKSVKS